MNKKQTKKPVRKKNTGKSPSGKALTSRSTVPGSTSSRSTKKSSAFVYPRKEIVTIGLIFLSIVLLLSYYLNAFGPLGNLIKNLGCDLFGLSSYTVPIIVIIATVQIFLKGTLSPHKHRYVFSSIGIVCLSGLHTLYYSTVDSVFFTGSNAKITSIIETALYSGKECDSGGLIGALISLPLRSLVSTAGAAVILSFLALVCFVTATGTEPITRFAKFISRKVLNLVDDMHEERQKPDEEELEVAIKDKPAEKEPKRRKILPENKEPDSKEEQTDFKINLYDKKEEEKKENISIPTEPVEIPEDIKKLAMEESGGVEEEKVDNTPIEVTDDEIESDYIEYTFPPIDLLKLDKSSSGGDDRPEDLRTQAKKLIETLSSFGVEAKVLEVSKGPSVTRFELQPSAGVKVSKIVNLADDIALNLAAFGVRIEAPIPGKAAVGIEIPNKTTSMVSLREVIDCEAFKSFKSKTAFAMGKDISGEPVISDISKMPHMLIAGATGSGKSVCINSLITSILYKADPNQVKMILIDPKVVELGVYNGIPHLLIPVVTDPRRAAGALNWAVQEMVKRYRLFADTNVRDIKGYNEYAAMSGERELEQIIIIIDELADLMMVSPHEVEDSICRLAQMARAAGMHLVIATQRPSVDVITGLIKANVPSRIAFSVSSQIDSRTILDMGGAEKLLGKGDMLFLPMGASKPKRIQGAFISDKEVERIVEFVKSGSSAHYNEDIIEHIENGAEENQRQSDDSDADELLPQAMEIVVELGQASASLLQRKLKVGYSRAGRLIDQLEERGIIGPHEGSKPRNVLMSRAEYQEMMLNSENE